MNVRTHGKSNKVTISAYEGGWIWRTGGKSRMGGRIFTIYLLILFWSFLKFLMEIFFFYVYLFMYLFLSAWVFVAVHGPSRGYSLVAVPGFSLRWLLLLQSTGSRVWAQQLWCTGLVTLWHMGIFLDRDQTYVPCIGRRILNHWSTREVLFWFLKHLNVSTGQVLKIK